MPELPAETLRRAAKAMRAHAAAATPGPWTSLNDGDRLIHEHDDGTDDFTYVVDEPMSNAANAAYIASWHPKVAFAVSVWLDAVAAKNLELAGLLGIHSAPAADPEWDAALNVARTYLGEADV